MSLSNDPYPSDAAIPPKLSKSVLPGVIGKARVKRHSPTGLITASNTFSDLRTSIEQDLQSEPSPLIKELDVPLRPLITLQSWIGTVESVDGEFFIASLQDKTNPMNPVEEVVLPIEEISPPDLALLAVGSLFYWKIGYRTSSSGQRERVSTIRFARLGTISPRESDHLTSQAKKLAEFLLDDANSAQAG
jgi:hypothetical protein